MQWIVDKIPDQSLLNTAGWRFIVPQLYKKYPNDDMNMNLSLSSPPILRISEHNLDATVYADLIIDVLEADQVIPVACISLVRWFDGDIEMFYNLNHCLLYICGGPYSVLLFLIFYQEL